MNETWDIFETQQQESDFFDGIKIDELAGFNGAIDDVMAQLALQAKSGEVPTDTFKPIFENILQSAEGMLAFDGYRAVAARVGQLMASMCCQAPGIEQTQQMFEQPRTIPEDCCDDEQEDDDEDDVPAALRKKRSLWFLGPR